MPKLGLGGVHVLQAFAATMDAAAADMAAGHISARKATSLASLLSV